MAGGCTLLRRPSPITLSRVVSMLPPRREGHRNWSHLVRIRRAEAQPERELGVHVRKSDTAEVSERSERAFWNTRTMKCAKWLQTATSTTKLTHPIRFRLARSLLSCFVKNAHRFARRSVATIKVEDSDVARDSDDNNQSNKGKKGTSKVTGGGPLSGGMMGGGGDDGGSPGGMQRQTSSKAGRGNNLKDEVMDLKYSPKGTHLAIAVRDNCIYIYKIDMVNGGGATDSDCYKLISIMKGHTSTVTNLDWSVDGKFLQSTGSDAEVSERNERNERNERALMKTRYTSH